MDKYLERMLGRAQAIARQRANFLALTALPAGQGRTVLVAAVRSQTERTRHYDVVGELIGRQMSWASCTCQAEPQTLARPDGRRLHLCKHRAAVAYAWAKAPEWFNAPAPAQPAALPIASLALAA